ncbi:MAG: ATP-binding protein, partial [Candidatus Heimdallarchaeota archaeon]|nr:ATP-binding protein [Candidatus Heimdallarchaeota archaeon]
GKTYRTHQLVNEMNIARNKENVCRIQFNDHRVANIAAEKLHVIDDAYYAIYPDKRDREDVLFIFDEIHRIKGWEDYILYLLESKTHKVVITGSTATLIRGQFASQLRGKIFPVRLYPFSFKEFLRHYHVEVDYVSSKGQSYLQNTFKKYLNQGGFPGLLDIHEDRHIELLRTYWDTMLLRDIIEANEKSNINISVLRYFSDALVTRIGCPMTVTRIAENMKSYGFPFSMETLYRYLSHLSDAYMIDSVEFYSESEKVRARNYKKIYCVDWALARAVSYGVGIDDTRVLENIVYVELKRRGFDVSYYKTREGFEIDFVAVNKKKELELIQVAFGLEDKSAREREFRPLETAAKYLKAKKVSVITFNEEKSECLNGTAVQVVPVWKWLLK